MAFGIAGVENTRRSGPSFSSQRAIGRVDPDRICLIACRTVPQHNPTAGLAIRGGNHAIGSCCCALWGGGSGCVQRGREQRQWWRRHCGYAIPFALRRRQPFAEPIARSELYQIRRSHRGSDASIYVRSIRAWLAFAMASHHTSRRRVGLFVQCFGGCLERAGQWA